MKIPLDGDYLLIQGKNSFLLAGIASVLFILFIETNEKELCQTVEKGDMIVVSAPEGGDIRHAAMLLELIRTYHQPLVVLPKGHPGSFRLEMVVSAGPEILPGCGILRGTHPEQNVICSSEELSGISLFSCEGGILVKGVFGEDLTYQVISPENIF